MRKVIRTQEQTLPPSALNAKKRDGTTELERSRAHYAVEREKKESYDFVAYKADEVKWRLNALFHYKCAYCESFFSASAPVDIEHYRPKGAVSEDAAHPGYWWLAMDWDNLLPSCIDCNRKRKQRLVDGATELSVLLARQTQSRNSSGKQDSFPVARGGQRLMPEDKNYVAESPLLLNPYYDNPDEHIQFVSIGNPPVSLAIPIGEGPSERGVTSIHIYGLNRLGLVQERTRYLRRLVFLGEMLISLGELVEEIEATPISDEIKVSINRKLELLMKWTGEELKQMTSVDQPYSAMATAWVIGFKAAMAEH
ncbi:HNH endonuclease [Yersinia enterocolitica]|uniref:HNH endonuclease n=1 Tax=Yersiniaceae TaxID=1903411 RepID=UPI0022FE7DB2|nr:HNH endonuclease [Yersinia intermedia]EKN4790090.1 HNH endonuclease [Yersinia enterocolitica]EKN5155268.1 HNH endonuclease [Yersinia enterocolitica]EKN5159885.1 HNH endonuclease [Yersinia enterocolitica]ELI8358562.1 HNH endonuclease [Yersinia enterocolitica]MDA5511359.1 HNH endonuclease [Yersinia intermedia]